MKPILQKVGLLIMLLLTSLVADANRTFEIDGLLYSVNSDPYLTGLGIVYLEPNPSREYSGDITVPDIVRHGNYNYKIIGVANEAFLNCQNLNSITFKMETDIDLGCNIFEGCINLKYIKLPTALTALNSESFKNCVSLERIDIPKSVRLIGDSCFKNCQKLSSVVIPHDLIILGESAFMDCIALKNVYFTSDELPYLDGGDEGVFSGCSSAINLWVPDTTLYHFGKNYVSFLQSQFEYSADIPDVTIINNLGSLAYEVLEFPLETSSGEYETHLKLLYKDSYSFEVNIPFYYKIVKAPLTILVRDAEREYGLENPSFKLYYIGFKGTDTESSTFENIPVSECIATKQSEIGTYEISIHGGFAVNYDLNYIINGHLKIVKAPLTLTAQNACRFYYEENPRFDFLLEGVRNNDDVTCIITAPQFACSATLASDCGSYEIIPSAATAKNYEISYKSGTLTITQAPLTLVASNISREYGEPNPILKYTANGLKGDDTVLSALNVDPIVSTTATESSNIGEYPIVISGGTSTNYYLSYRSGILTVTKAPLTVITENAERQYGESNPTFSRSYSGFKLDDTESSAFSSLPRLSCAATRTSDVGEYPIVVSGGISRNYEVVSYENGVLKITKAPLTLVATDKSRLYFEENPSFDFTLIGLRNSDTKSCLTIQPTFKCAAAKTSNAGEYEIEPLNATAQNYAIDYQKGTLSINKRNLTASVGNYTKIYGSENPQFDINYIGFVNNEDESVLTNAPNIVCSANKASDVGSYPISLDGGNAPNYDISKYIPGTLTIEKADQIITWNQDLSNIQMYTQVALEASSSADLPVSYEMSPNNVASLYNNNGRWYLDCFGSGAVNIRAVQNGDKNHNAAAMVSNTLVVMGTGGDPSNPQIFLNIENAGTLPNLIADNRKYQIKNLRLTGYLNGTDINFLREMSGSDSYGNSTPGILETLDISGCSIISGGRSYYRSCKTANNMVGDYMFYNCKQLVNLMLPDNTTVIEDYAFADCDRLSVISIPERVKAFGVQSFRNDINLLRIPMPSGLTSINDYAFMGCNGLSEITIPASVTNIGDGIVKDCQNISKINVAEGNSHFASENGVLYTSIFDKLLIFPVNYESSSYAVKDGTKTIAPYAFVNSKRLSEVTLPSTLSNIGADAFIGSVNLSSLQVKALNPPICDNYCFEAVSKTRCELIVPKGCYSYYWVAPVWSDFNKIKESDFNSGIDDILFSDVRVGVENSNIVIGGVPESNEVRIFKVDGTLIYQAPSTGDVFYYRPAQSGIYIIVIGNKTYKLTVR